MVIDSRDELKVADPASGASGGSREGTDAKHGSGRGRTLRAEPAERGGRDLGLASAPAPTPASLAEAPAGIRNPREELLDRCQAWFASNGLRGHSLRQIAAGVGTSHRMLIYHFGSREGLLAEIVGRTEAATREILTGFSSMPDPAAANRAFWAYLADPALAESERMFYEIYAEALHDRPWTDSFRAAVIDATADPVEQLFAERGFDPEQAKIRARLSIAATRGLLLDLLLTGDQELLAEAAELFAGLVVAPGLVPVPADPTRAPEPAAE